MNPQTYSMSEAAELTGYSTRTLRRAIDAGDLLACRQSSGSIRISRAELAKWWRLRGGGDLFGDSASGDLLAAIREIVREEIAKGG